MPNASKVVPADHGRGSVTIKPKRNRAQKPASPSIHRQDSAETLASSAKGLATDPPACPAPTPAPIAEAQPRELITLNDLRLWLTALAANGVNAAPAMTLMAVYAVELWLPTLGMGDQIMLAKSLADTADTENAEVMAALLRLHKRITLEHFPASISSFGGRNEQVAESMAGDYSAGEWTKIFDSLENAASFLAWKTTNLLPKALAELTALPENVVMIYGRDTDTPTVHILQFAAWLKIREAEHQKTMCRVPILKSNPRVYQNKWIEERYCEWLARAAAIGDVMVERLFCAVLEQFSAGQPTALDVPRELVTADELARWQVVEDPETDADANLDDTVTP